MSWISGDRSDELHMSRQHLRVTNAAQIAQPDRPRALGWKELTKSRRAPRLRAKPSAARLRAAERRALKGHAERRALKGRPAPRAPRAYGQSQF